MERDILKWTQSKIVHLDGKPVRMIMEIGIGGCYEHNKHCDLFINLMMQEKKRNGSWDTYAWGWQDEYVPKYFKEIEKFLPLHNCNELGQPMYPQANGMYILNKDGYEKGKRYLRLTDDEAERLQIAAKTNDKDYFAVMLKKLGVLRRCKQEADEFIAFVEEKTGSKFVNPVAEEERRYLVVDDDLELRIDNLLMTGYYDDDAILERARQKAEDERRKSLQDKIAQYEKDIEKAKREIALYQYLYDVGMPFDNVIFYTHKNEVVFNWLEYHPQVSQEQFVDFVSRTDLPEGITFKLGGKKNYGV